MNAQNKELQQIVKPAVPLNANIYLFCKRGQI